MKILNIKLLFGTEVFLQYNNLFEQMLNQNIFDFINFSICKETLSSLRGSYGDSFYEDNVKVAKFILSDERMNFVDDQSFESMDPPKLASMFSLKESFNVNKNLIQSHTLDLPNKFVTISTKIQYSLSIRDYEVISPSVFNFLNDLQIPVVILGERKITPCREYDIHNPFTIYDSLIQNLNNYVDFSIESSDKNSGLDELKKSFYILSKSSLNIFMSWSGVKRVVLYSSDNVIGLTQNLDVSKRTDGKVFLTNNPVDFIEKLTKSKEFFDL